MALQGRCRKCAVRWEWTGELPLRDCGCPECGEPLKRTLYSVKLPLRLALNTGFALEKRKDVVTVVVQGRRVALFTHPGGGFLTAFPVTDNLQQTICQYLRDRSLKVSNTDAFPYLAEFAR